MSESVLADRLALLVETGIFVRVEYASAPVRHEYRLSACGLDLWKLLVAQVEWERRFGAAGERQPRLTHRACGAEVSPRLVCAKDGAVVSARDTAVEISDLRAAAGAVPPGVRRRSVKPDPAHPELSLDATLAVIGDRWSAVLVGLALTGVRRFVDFERAMGAAPTIVTDRLGRLVAADVLATVVPDGARRAEYRLTPKGRALFPFYALLVAWCDRWLADEGPRLLRIRHRRHSLEPQLRCSACGQRLTRRSVSYRPLPAPREGAA